MLVRAMPLLTIYSLSKGLLEHGGVVKGRRVKQVRALLFLGGGVRTKVGTCSYYVT
jgi:hypothetical protein